jgi:hypothetical protein
LAQIVILFWILERIRKLGFLLFANILQKQMISYMMYEATFFICTKLYTLFRLSKLFVLSDIKLILYILDFFVPLSFPIIISNMFFNNCLFYFIINRQIIFTITHLSILFCWKIIVKQTCITLNGYSIRLTS